MTDVITAADMLRCAERELKMRKGVYPRWIENGRISEGAAAHQLACMEEIVKTLRPLAEKDRLL